MSGDLKFVGEKEIIYKRTGRSKPKELAAPGNPLMRLASR